MAYTKTINRNSEDSHQTSPAYVLTFLRYSNRDSVNYSFDTLATRDPLIVVNDAVSVTVQYSKNNPNHFFSCVLKQGDLNYLTAISPGDYVTVNMVNWKKTAMDIRQNIINKKPINKSTDGFKGLFKVLSVGMSIGVDPGSGQKQYQVEITGRGFDEFNNLIYFNPAIQKVSNAAKTDVLLLANAFGDIGRLIQRRDNNNVHNLAKEIIIRTIGKGTKPLLDRAQLAQIDVFKVPPGLGQLMNVTAQNMSDINKYYIGNWPPSSRGFSSFFQLWDSGGNNNFYRTATELQGSRALSVEDFQNVSAWSILQNYTNTSINESYTCYRVDKNNFIFPSVIIRQKPFNTNHFEKFIQDNGFLQNIQHTKFLDLPRWKISPDLITNLSLGRSDVARFNFVQVWTRALTMESNLNEALQMTAAYQNFVEDKKDIIRNGRKPYIVNANFDYPRSDAELRSKEWALLIADWVFNGHLKLNGSIQTIGIEDAICIGDNLELDNIVYHIENISHNMTLSPDGVNIFRTNLSLAHGVSDDSSSTVPVYAEMDHSDTFKRRKADFDTGEGILPGYSDTQDIPSRTDGEETKRKGDVSFTNPGKQKNKNKRAKPIRSDDPVLTDKF